MVPKIAGMAAQISDAHIAAFATEATWDELPGVLAAKYDGVASRIVIYNALADREKVQRYGDVARKMRC